MTDTDNRRTVNTVHGAPETLVQAGIVHGDVHITSGPAQSPNVPRQLPLPTNGFVDRKAQLRRLDELAREAATSVPIVILAGQPGVGKSALAVRWAHHARPHFPDGDLYVNMYGHTSGPRAQASQALDTVLRALGVPTDRIPLDMDARSALFRSEVHGKNLLLVIDDVFDAAQARPLLPSSLGCMVVITSRSTLSGLVAREGAQRLPLSVLPQSDSLDLLRNTIGARVDSQPQAARSLAGHCAHLPLALRLAAERLMDRPDAELSDLVNELAAEESRLDALSEEDELSDLRAVMATSYQALDTATARFFRLLGAHPGPEFSVLAAAALTDTTPAEAGRMLDRLVRANLVERPRATRYRLHDLVRLYAVERVRLQEGQEATAEAVGRAARWYTHAAARAQLTEHPHFPVVPGTEPPEGLPEFASLEEALTWFEAERANLLAVTEAALDHGHHDTAWRLPATVYPLFELHRHWHQWRDLHSLGLRAAENAANPWGLARNHLGMGDAQWLLGDLDSAVRHYESALTVLGDITDPWVEGFASRQLGVVLWQRGERDDTTIEHVERAIALFQGSGERRGEAMGSLSLADFHADLGRWEKALDHCRAAIDVFTAIGAKWSVAWAGCTLGRVLTGMNRAAEAVPVYRSAIETFTEHQDTDSHSVALLGLGEAHAALGDVAKARQAWNAALDRLRDHGDPRVARVEERLSTLGS